MPDVDTTKVDGKNLTLVVVEVVKSKANKIPAKYRLACSKGPIKGLFHRAHLTTVKYGTKKSMGLSEVYDGKAWKGMAEMSARTAYNHGSMVGGQGKLKCNCRKGKCASNGCSCFKAGVVCGSSCHGGKPNKNCINFTKTKPV